MSTKAVRRTAAVVLVLSAVMASGIAVLAGTSTSFVVTRGASMEPAYSSDDLAVLRPASDYRVGDVAAYRSRTLNRVVLHRVVGVDGDAVTFRGDANSFVDPEVVRGSDIVGKAVMRLPHAGAVLLWLASPVNVGLMLLLTALGASRLRRRASTPSDAAQVEVTTVALPRDLTLADVADPDALVALAARYDQPVLRDTAAGVLFVVAGGTAFRCAVPQTAASDLALVRDLVPRPTSPAAEPWRLEGRRRPGPYGRDWNYGPQQDEELVV